MQKREDMHVKSGNIFKIYSSVVSVDCIQTKIEFIRNSFVIQNVNVDCIQILNFSKIKLKFYRIKCSSDRKYTAYIK